MLQDVQLQDVAQYMSSWTTQKLLARLDLCTMTYVVPAPQQPGAAAGSPGLGSLYMAPCEGDASQRIWSADLKVSETCMQPGGIACSLGACKPGEAAAQARPASQL